MNQLLKEKYQASRQFGLRNPRILVAPLDWGLGHVTRCVPIIEELLRLQCEVWIATDGPQQQLLQKEFPGISFLKLDGYKIKYSTSHIGTVFKILLQSKKILRAITNENAWLKKQVKEYFFDAVISDNRYGLYHTTIPCVFITHQLRIKSPFGRWTENILQKRNYRFINRFSECWVPDEEEEINLAGELSHPVKKPAVPVKYLGILSRLSTLNIEEKKDHLLIILSGPEPQRSILENKIIAELSHYNGTATVVRGLPESGRMIPSTNMIRFYNHLNAEELGIELSRAEYIISRCGYSTVMDVVRMQKKSILVPTPGQSEQEYLADYLSLKHIACCSRQKEFSLIQSLNKAKQFSYHLPLLSKKNNLKNVIEDLIIFITNSRVKSQ